MLSNIIIFVLFVLVIVAYIIANAIMTVIAIKDGNTISGILSEQDYGLGKIGVSIMYWPTFVILYIKSLLPINTKSCFDEEIIDDYESNHEFRHYTLSEILNLPLSEKVILTPENYMEFLKYAGIANRNKDVEIDIHNETIKAKFFSCHAFYGIKTGILVRYHKPDNIMRYVVTCYHASRQ